MAAWTVISSLDTLVAHFASTESQAKWAGWWHPHGSWETWLIGILSITLAGMFEGSYRTVSRLEGELQAIKNSGPNIILREPGAKHTQEIRFLDLDATLTFVKVRFINAKRDGNSTVKGTRIRAKIKFLDDSGNTLLNNMDGRWDASPSPSTQLSVNDLLPKDFDIEEEQNVDVAFWNPLNQSFVGYNNDSWRYPNLLKPEHVLGKGPITAKIRLVGDAYDKTFDVRFGEEGNMVKILD